MARLSLCLVLAACADPCATIDHVRARDATHVEVKFACDAPDMSGETIGNYLVAPPQMLAVKGADSNDQTAVLTTDAQIAGTEYTLRYSGQSANFVGVGDAPRAQVTLRVDDSYNQSLHAVRVLATFDPQTGFFSHFENGIDLKDNGDHSFSATVGIAVSPLRTLDTTDDRLGPDHIAYAVRAIDPATGAPLSKLVSFEVKTSAAQTVPIPLLTVPPPPSPEGLVDVTFDVDDSPAHALTAPSLRGAIDANGNFDPSFPTRVPLAAAGGAHYSGHTRVRIDPNRVHGGTTSNTFPYVFYLSDAGTDYQNKSVEIVAPDESAQMGSIIVGNPALVPVVFRVDISRAYLTLDGVQRGKFASESIFITGQFNVAEDAFGRNAADAFTGGENLVLEMKERSDHPGLWTRTIFLPPNRPYGWKIVRCPAGVGCSELNRHVVSSGRAFATVMKNLATENIDGATTVNPLSPGAYAAATIYHGMGMGREGNPPGAPNPQTMFKQECPDLVVTVADQPLVTPVQVVGTWRDVNMPQRPPDIIASGAIFDLNPWDYDQGFVGVGPPTYALDDTPPINLMPTDGMLDMAARQIAPSLWAAKSGSTLYVATGFTTGDRFLFVSPSMPTGAQPAPWAKSGTVPFGPDAVFLAAEADNAFAGWFHQSGMGFSSPVGRGAVLEGTVDLGMLGMPAHVWLQALSYQSPDGGTLVDSTMVMDVDLSIL